MVAGVSPRSAKYFLTIGAAPSARLIKIFRLHRSDHRAIRYSDIPQDSRAAIPRLLFPRASAALRRIPCSHTSLQNQKYRRQAPQPKQCHRCRSGEMLNDGDFSWWNGQSALEIFPRGRERQISAQKIHDVEFALDKFGGGRWHGRAMIGLFESYGKKNSRGSNSR